MGVFMFVIVSTVADYQTDQQKQTGQSQIECLEFPGEFCPGIVRGAGEAWQ